LKVDGSLVSGHPSLGDILSNFIISWLAVAIDNPCTKIGMHHSFRIRSCYVVHSAQVFCHTERFSKIIGIIIMTCHHQQRLLDIRYKNL